MNASNPKGIAGVRSSTVNENYQLPSQRVHEKTVNEIRRPCRCYSKAGRRLGPPKVSSIDLPFHLCSQVQTDHQAVRPPKLSLLRGPRLLRDLRDPGLPRQRFKRPAGLDPGLPRQRFKTPQAALAVKAVISKGSSTARFGRQSCHF